FIDTNRGMDYNGYITLSGRTVYDSFPCEFGTEKV